MKKFNLVPKKFKNSAENIQKLTYRRDCQVMALRKNAHNFVSSKGQVCSQIVVNVNVKRFRLVTHSTAVSFSIKTFFL